MTFRIWPARPGRTVRSLGVAGPWILVGAAALALWLATGVAATDVAVFLAYHTVFVVAPGWAIYRLLRPADGMRLRQLVFGWAIGYVLEVLAFAASASVGARGLLVLYPMVVFAVAALLWRCRVRGRPATVAAAQVTRGWSWAVAGLCVLALAFLGVEYFGSTPLPDKVTRVSYGIDTVWYLSIAAEALHHWPVGDPTVAGQPLYYHLFASLDPAAIAQVTGLGLPVVFFRLYTVPMIVLTVLGLCLTGATVGGAWAGPIAAALALFGGELNLDPHVGYKFANELGDDIVAISPSFLLGAALFVPALALLCEFAAEARPRRMPYAALAVFALLMVGAAGAKAPIPPTVAGGLILYLACYAVARRALHHALVIAVGITVIAFAGFWLLSYGGAGSDQLSLHPPGTIRQMDVTSYVASLLGPRAGWAPALWIGLTAIGIVGAYGAQLVGLAATRRDRLRNPALLLLALFAVGQLPYLLFTHPGLSQVFFAEYGVLAACLVSAEGLRLVWLGSDSRAGLAWCAAGCAALTTALALTLPMTVGAHGDAGRKVYLYADLALAGLLALTYLTRARWRPDTRRWGYVAVTTLAVAAASRMLTVAAPTITQLAHGRPLYSQTGDGLTAGLYRALSWIRTHSSPSAVVAVNNFRDWSLYWSDGWAVPDDFNYSAFAERPVFLEGWIYTNAASKAGDAVYAGRQLLFPGRVGLNNAIFQWAHADALRSAAQRYGVRYLLVDRVHNEANPRLGTIAQLVYANRDADVYAVRSALALSRREREGERQRALQLGAG